VTSTAQIIIGFSNVVIVRNGRIWTVIQGGNVSNELFGVRLLSGIFGKNA